MNSHRLPLPFVGLALSAALLFAGCGSESEVAGTWTVAQPMSTARMEQSANVLLDGRVLVAGGTTRYDQHGTDTFNAEPTASTELFDPATGAWSPGPSMAEARWDFPSALLQDGRVFVIGSSFNVQKVYVGDSYSWHGASANTELYDPKSNTWSAGARMSRPRPGAAMGVLADGRVLVAGGIHTEQDGSAETWAAVSSAEVYDPGANVWREIAPIARARAYFQAVVLRSGKVLLSGEMTSELYDPTTDVWSESTWPEALGPMEDFVLGIQSDGKVLAFGNQAVAVFAEGTNSWSAANIAPLPGAGALIHLNDNRTLLFGNGPQRPYSRLLDAAGNGWVDGGEPHFIRAESWATALLHDGRVLVMPSWSSYDSAEVELFTPR